MNIDRDVEQLKKEIKGFKEWRRREYDDKLTRDFNIVSGKVNALRDQWPGMREHLNRLNEELATARNQLETLGNELNQARREFAGVADRMQSESQQRASLLRNELDDTRDEFSTKVDETEMRLQHVEDALNGLGRRVRAASEGQIADLDDVDPETQQWAGEAELGRQAKAWLLPDGKRGELQALIREHEQAHEQRAIYLAEVLRTTSALATEAVDSPGHAEAAAAYRSAAPRLKKAIDDTQRLAAPAQEAGRQLAEDDHQRETLAPTIEAADRARNNLHARLEARISDTVNRGVVMPMWFDSAFELMPPARNPHVWLEIATDVLAYRTTYRVTHPLLALGPRLSGDEPMHRRTWHQDLEQRLASISSYRQP